MTEEHVDHAQVRRGILDGAQLSVVEFVSRSPENDDSDAFVSLMLTPPGETIMLNVSFCGGRGSMACE